MHNRYYSGFTLIELIIVMVILTILFGALILDVNPGKRTAQARNTQRRTNIHELMNAVQQYAADHHGNLPNDVLSATSQKCIGTDLACRDLSLFLVQEYIPSIPLDPGGPDLTGGTEQDSKYTILYIPASKRVTIAAPNAENGEVIVISE